MFCIVVRFLSLFSVCVCGGGGAGGGAVLANIPNMFYEEIKRLNQGLFYILFFF